ncbi:MAG TPA: LptF/LptG family permease, partial [Verrucomicrobiae bacterium]|nr:LptF/LptG family permease [Verrucomicrobiae bacterium]
ITEDRFITEIPGIVLYIRKKDGDKLEDVRLYTLEKNRIKTRTSASSGLILFDPVTKSLRLQLSEVLTEAQFGNLAHDEDLIGPPTLEKPPEWQPAYSGMFTTDPFDLAPLIKAERKPKLSEMDFRELAHERRQLEARGISTSPVRVQIHRQISFSFACFAFTLIGIPLAIQAHRRETTIGVAIALGLVLVYYGFLILGEALAAREHLYPHLILWYPNFLFQALGALLLSRASRG